MTPWTVTTLIIIAVAIFVLGGVAGWIWHHRRGSERGEEVSRRINIGLSAFFVLVALMVVFDVVSLTVKFNNYVNETIPRDRAQEECNTKTVEVLAAWVQSRLNRDAAMDGRDEAAIRVLDQGVMGKPPNPADVKAWRDAVAIDRAARVDFSQNPLPNC